MTEAESHIRAAWADDRLEPGAAITPPCCLRCDEIAAHFEASHWSEHTNVEELRAHVGALSLFSPAAFCHFLPAFLLATLADPAEADVIPQYVCHSFTPSPEFEALAFERINLLTAAQREALVSWFGELLERGVFLPAEVAAAQSLLTRV